MRLMVPVETSSMPIINGPTPTRLLKVQIKRNSNGEPCTGPHLQYTVESPIDGTPLELTLWVMSDWRDYGGEHYVMDALIIQGDGEGDVNRIPVVVKDRFAKNESGYRGSIEQQ